MSSSPASPSRPRLKLALKPAAESAVRSGHPWVYSESIRQQNREGESGELAVIYDRKDRFLAAGFYDPDSPIRVRVVHRGKPLPIDDAFWEARLEEALSWREGLVDASTNGLRLINGESDGWPGLVLDRYADTYVLKLYAAAWLPRVSWLRDRIRERLSAERIVLRLSRHLQNQGGGLEDGSVLLGSVPEGPIVFLENGLRFEADVLKGQKTGFFLDQRENRRLVEDHARGKQVLNAFSFSGGFSLYAARGGAILVLDLDISAHALASAQRNFSLNRDHPRLAACLHETVQADAFAWLEQARADSFDLVIVDPPSLAKRESERQSAVQAYTKLNAAALRLLRPGGLLVAASCSAHVSEAEFYGAVRQAGQKARVRVEELAARGHAPDHPARFPEARYLKCLFLRKG